MNILRIVSFLAVLSITSGCSETFHSEYPTKKDVIQDRAIERGWVPEILPDSAKNIVETHDIDTNAAVGQFDFSQSDARVFKTKLGDPLDKKIHEGLANKYPVLKGDQIYKWKDFVFAVDWRKNKATYVLEGD